MRIVATSDLHGFFPEIPECDLLLIAGDICPISSKEFELHNHEKRAQQNWLKGHFRPWLAEQPAKDVIWIAGNHDFGCESASFPYMTKHFPGHYLIDQGVEVMGKTIYGIPWTPNLVNWAFYARTDIWDEIAKSIPTDTDILVMHAPAMPVGGKAYPVDWGAPSILRQEITNRIKPELVVWGHVHEGYGTKEYKGVQFANVAHCDETYDPINPPMVFDLEDS